MEWLGLVALMLLLLHAAYPGRVRRLEAQVRRLQRAQQGEADMARLIQELVGRACELSVEDAYQLTGRPTLACTVLDADDEWVNVRYADRKGRTAVKLLRIEKIGEVTLPDAPAGGA